MDKNKLKEQILKSFEIQKLTFSEEIFDKITKSNLSLGELVFITQYLGSEGQDYLIAFDTGILIIPTFSSPRFEDPSAIKELLYTSINSFTIKRSLLDNLYVIKSHNEEISLYFLGKLYVQNLIDILKRNNIPIKEKSFYQSSNFVIGASVVLLLASIPLITTISNQSDSSSSSYSSNSFPASQSTKAWYEGGNLHQAKMIEWKNATLENKLATMADVLGVYLGKERMPALMSGDTTRYKMMAMTVVDCMENFNNSMYDNDPIGATAFICLNNLQMKEVADRVISHAY